MWATLNFFLDVPKSKSNPSSSLNQTIKPKTEMMRHCFLMLCFVMSMAQSLYGQYSGTCSGTGGGSTPITAKLTFQVSNETVTWVINSIDPPGKGTPPSGSMLAKVTSAVGPDPNKWAFPVVSGWFLYAQGKVVASLLWRVFIS